MNTIIKPSKKYYSIKAIGIATFLGGPLVAGYLISENYKSSDQPDDAKNALMIGIIVTIILFSSIWFIPDYIYDKIPNSIIPTAYTAIIIALVKAKQGDILDEHESNELPFYSNWRAAGLGLISLLIMGGSIMAYAFYGPSSKAYDDYAIEMESFMKNEEEGLVVFDHFDTNSTFELITEIKNTTIPKWEENIEIINKSNQIADLPTELKERNILLLRYCNLRIESFELMKKGMVENTEKYSPEIDKIINKIDILIDELNRM